MDEGDHREPRSLSLSRIVWRVPPLSDSELASLRSTFEDFAREAAGTSPLYERLSLESAEDDAVVSLLTAAPTRQRRPNLLFAAAHDILLSGTDHELATYYPSVGGRRRPDGDTFAVFRSFIEDFDDEIVSRLQNRATQTNEPGRCAALRAGLGQLPIAADRPLAVLELGTSAGLLLHVDRYRYRYDGVSVGAQDAPVTISTELRGGAPPEFGVREITERIGIDLDPLDPADPADASWLKACVWPEDVKRMKRLHAALLLAAEHNDVRFIQGDLTELLEPVVRAVNPDIAVCVMHSATLAYLDESTFHVVERTLDRLGAERDMSRLAFEGPFVEPFATQAQRLVDSADDAVFLLGLTTWVDGSRADRLLATAQPHGAWLEWLGR